MWQHIGIWRRSSYIQNRLVIVPAQSKDQFHLRETVERLSRTLHFFLRCLQLEQACLRPEAAVDCWEA